MTGRTERTSKSSGTGSKAAGHQASTPQLDQRDGHRRGPELGPDAQAEGGGLPGIRQGERRGTSRAAHPPEPAPPTQWAPGSIVLPSTAAQPRPNSTVG